MVATRGGPWTNDQPRIAAATVTTSPAVVTGVHRPFIVFAATPAASSASGSKVSTEPSEHVKVTASEPTVHRVPPDVVMAVTAPDPENDVTAGGVVVLVTGGVVVLVTGGVVVFVVVASKVVVASSDVVVIDVVGAVVVAGSVVGAVVVAGSVVGAVVVVGCSGAATRAATAAVVATGPVAPLPHAASTRTSVNLMSSRMFPRTPSRRILPFSSTRLERADVVVPMTLRRVPDTPGTTTVDPL